MKRKCEGCYRERETKLTKTEYDRLWLCESCRKRDPNIEEAAQVVIESRRKHMPFSKEGAAI